MIYKGYWLLSVLIAIYVVSLVYAQFLTTRYLNERQIICQSRNNYHICQHKTGQRKCVMLVCQMIVLHDHDDIVNLSDDYFDLSDDTIDDLLGGNVTC